MDTEQIIDALKAERQRIDGAIAALEGGSGKPARTGHRGPRHMSAEARRRISEAQKKRWAASKKRSGSSVAKAPGPKRSGISAAGRKRLSEMMKKRWAARKKQKAA